MTFPVFLLAFSTGAFAALLPDLIALALRLNARRVLRALGYVLFAFGAVVASLGMGAWFALGVIFIAGQ